MAIKYWYKKYENYPEATEISESRERGKVCETGICIVLILASIIALLFFDIVETWPAIFMLIGAVLRFRYLCTRYDEITEEKIQKAISDRIIMLNDVANSTYKCKYIKQLNETKLGSCKICGLNEQSLLSCEIKNDIGKRKIFICSDCINKFKSNAINLK